MALLTKRHALFTAGVVGAIGASVLGVGMVFAQGPSGGHTAFMSEMVNTIAQKFHLDPAAVQATVDAQHAQDQAKRQEQMQAHLQTRLADAVKSGAITQTQSDAILAKQAEVKTFMDGLKGKTPAERQAAMQAEKTALMTWAQTNGIPAQYITPVGGGRGHRGGMNGFGRGMGGPPSGMMQNR